MRDLPVLTADCSSCAGLCCVLLPFKAANGFGVDKPGGTPCHNLSSTNLCTIHDRLDSSGWSGCSRYDCQGAGQHVTQVTYAGRDWRSGEVNLAEMAAVFSVMRLVFEMLADGAVSAGAGIDLREVLGWPVHRLLALDVSELVPDLPGE